jgi:hypothetical protein
VNWGFVHGFEGRVEIKSFSALYQL